MNYEVKTYKYICDLCKDIAFVQAMHNELPKSWHRHTEGGHGMTNYDKDYDYCDLCTPAKKTRGEIK